MQALVVAPPGLSGVTPDAGPARSIPWPPPVQTGFSVRHLAAVPAPRPLSLRSRSRSGLFSFIGGPEEQCLPARAQMSPVPKSPAGLGLYPERRTDDLPATTLSLPSVRRDLSQVHPQVTLSMTVLKPSLAFWDLQHHLQGLPPPT